MLQGATNSTMTNGHTDDLSVSVEDVKFLKDNSRLHLTHLEVQRVIDSAMLKYEESTLR